MALSNPSFLYKKKDVKMNTTDFGERDIQRPKFIQMKMIARSESFSQIWARDMVKKEGYYRGSSNSADSNSAVSL